MSTCMHLTGRRLGVRESAVLSTCRRGSAKRARVGGSGQRLVEREQPRLGRARWDERLVQAAEAEEVGLDEREQRTPGIGHQAKATGQVVSGDSPWWAPWSLPRSHVRCRAC
jgi:hypothetical protein